MPVGAFGGRREVMDALAPTGPVYQAGTLSGNPIAMAAGFACLTEVAQPGVHETLTDLTNQLSRSAGCRTRSGIPLVVNNVGGMFGLFFTDAETVTCYQDVLKCDVERFKRFFHLMLEEGVYLAPSAFEAGFMSIAHTLMISTIPSPPPVRRLRSCNAMPGGASLPGLCLCRPAKRNASGKIIGSVSSADK